MTISEHYRFHFSFTLWRKTEVMKAHVLEFLDGQCMTLITVLPRICGSIGPTVVTSITMENRLWHCQALLKEISLPVCWTWKPGPFPLVKMERYWNTFTNIACFLFFICTQLGYSSARYSVYRLSVLCFLSDTFWFL